MYPYSKGNAIQENICTDFTFPEDTFPAISMHDWKTFIRDKITDLKESKTYISDEEIADFVLLPIRQLEGENEALECVFHNGHKAKVVSLRDPDMASNTSFRKEHGGIGYNFIGTTENLSQLNSLYLRMVRVPTLYQCNQVGLYQHPVSLKWYWCNGSEVVDALGQACPDLEVRGTPSFPPELISQLQPKPGDGIEVSGWDFNAPSIVGKILGWSSATFFKPRLRQVFKAGFPILWPIGTSGAGKTSTTEYIIKKMWGLPPEEQDFHTITRFARLKLLSASNCVPVAFHEVKKKNDEWTNLVPDVYTSTVTSRGQSNLKVTHFKMSSPVIGTSEATYGTQATQERCLVVNFLLPQSKKHASDYKRFVREDLEQIGSALLYRAMTLTDEDIKDRFQRALQGVEKALPGEPDRSQWNLAVVVFGLEQLKKVAEFDAAHYIAALLEEEESTSGQEERVQSYVRETLRQFLAMMSMDFPQRLIKDRHYRIIPHDSLPKEVPARVKKGHSGWLLSLREIWPVYLAWVGSNHQPQYFEKQLDFSKQVVGDEYFLCKGSQYYSESLGQLSGILLTDDLLIEHGHLPDPAQDSEQKDNVVTLPSSTGRFASPNL